MSLLFDSALALYLVATVVYFGGVAFQREGALRAGAWILGLGGLANTAAIGLMVREAGRIPFTNTFETLVLFSWLIVVAGLAFERVLRLRIIGALVAPLALLFLGYAELQGDVELRPLIPALKSNWLLTHVTSYFIAYAVAAVSYAVGVLYLASMEGEDVGARAARAFGAANAGLVVAGLSYFALHLLLARLDALTVVAPLAERFRLPVDPKALGIALVLGAVAAWGVSGRRAAIAARLPAPEKLDRAIDLSLRFAFPFMTIGLVTGAVWANETWGTYWSWDPKETWALISWLVYASYLHARLIAGWRGRRTVALAVAGFLVIVFTYFGVNYLLSGLHSYA